MDIKTYISSGIIEEYALGVLSKEESSILECVMANNEEVKTAVLEMQTTFELLADAEAVTPPSELKSQIFAKLDFAKSIVEQENVVQSTTYSAPIIPLNKKTESSNFSKYAMIAASVLLLASLFALGYAYTNGKQQKGEIAKLNTDKKALAVEVNNLQNQNLLIINSKNIKLNGVDAHPGMLANIYWDDSKKVHLKLNNLPVAPQGQQYQLWAIIDGKPVSAGMFDGKHADEMQTMATINSAQAFAITLEKEGGSVSPTMENMYVMGTT